MRAAVVRHFGGTDALEYLPLPNPEPGPHEVAIRVRACGVNHLDLDIRSGISRADVELPLILGSEFSGEVLSLGSDVEGAAVGDRVAVSRQESCGHCINCLQGHENICVSGGDSFNRNAYGVTRDGGYAERCIVDARHLIRLPDSLSFEAAACYTGFATSHHMLFTKAHVQPGESVLVLAAGSSVGVAAVQLAKLAGAVVIAAAGSDEKLARASELGADHLINYSTSDVEREAHQLTDGRGADVVLDVVGGQLLTQALLAARRGGRVVTCGAHSGEVVPLDVVHFFRNELQFFGSFASSRWEIVRCFQLLASRRLRAVIHRVVPLHDVQAAHQELETRSNFGKVILVPNGAPRVDA